MKFLRLYFYPLLATLMIHGFLLYVVAGVWGVPHKVESRVKPPTPIRATLVKLEQTKPKAKAKQSTKPRVKAKPKPVSKPKVDNRAKQQALKAKQKKKAQEIAKRKKEEEKKARENREREQRELQRQLEAKEKQRAEELLTEALAEEEEFLEAETADEIAGAYVGVIRDAIQYHWSRPPNARNGMEVTLLIHLIPTGEVVSVSIVKGSGSEVFDRSAVNAVKKAERFSELQEMPPHVFESHFRRLMLVFRPEDLRL